MLVKPLQKCLIMILPHLSLIRQQKISLIVLPNLLNQYLLLKLIKIILNILRLADILAKPVDRLMSFQQRYIEDLAILAI